MYQPLIFKIECGDSNILDKSIDKSELLIQTSNINIPLMTLGFQYFLHRTRSSMGIIKNLDTKNEFYYIVNPFEYKISNFNNSLDKFINSYLNIKSAIQQINNHDFCKLWEILYFFDIIDNNLIYTSINDNYNSFIQSVINYKNKLNTINKNKKNKTIINIINTIDDNIYTSQDFIDSYNDITFNINSNKIDKHSNLITANGNLILDIDDNYEEQKSYELLLKQIITALKIQDLNGHFILKIFDTMTLPTVKILYLLTSLYKENYIYKPYFSRVSSSEKYLICKDFIYNPTKDNKLINNKIKILETCLKNIKPSSYIYDIIPKLQIPNNYLNQLKFINIKLSNIQQIMINNIIKYIKENNYFGDKYHEYYENQINSVQWWIDSFLPDNNTFIDTKKNIQDLFLSTINKYSLEGEKLYNILII